MTDTEKKYWQEIAVDFWKEIEKEAAELEVLERVSSSLESGIPVRVLKLSEVAINYQLRMIITFNCTGRKCIAIHPQFTDSKTMYICCEC